MRQSNPSAPVFAVAAIGLAFALSSYAAATDSATDAAAVSAPDPAPAAGPSKARGASPERAAAESGEGVAVHYKFTVTGVPEDELRELLERSANLTILRDEPPASVAALRRRAAADVDRLISVLRSRGFYGAEIDAAIDATAKPASVTFEVDTGPVYLLADYTVRYVPEAELADDLPRDPSALGLQFGMRAEAGAVVEAQNVLLDRLAESGHPFATVADREAVVAHDTATMAVTVTVDPGPRISYGPISLTGLKNVNEDYLLLFVTWREGQTYRRSEVLAFRRALQETGLFESVQAGPAGKPDESAAVPIEVRVIEGEQRSVGVGARFSSGEGFEGEVFWRHRNLFGNQERLTLTATAGQIVQGLKAEFQKPHFLRLDQSLLADFALRREDNDAFLENSAKASVGIDRALDDVWTVGVGGSLEYAEIEDAAGTETFTIAGLPLRLRYDTANSVLEPTRGARALLQLTPFVATLDEGALFARSELTGAHYVAFDDEDRIVLAVRGRVGSIVGTETEELPANKRFYAGGGGSVRGFEFQRVGPVDGNFDPLGGRSVYEVNLELRLRVFDSFGVVPFVDAGQVFDSSLPDLSETPLWAAGLGLRYYTAIGPVRLDVAVPINGRDNVDDDFQFYISIGQSF